MSTKNEKDQLKQNFDTKRAENASSEKMPSIWYT